MLYSSGVWLYMSSVKISNIDIFNADDMFNFVSVTSRLNIWRQWKRQSWICAFGNTFLNTLIDAISLSTINVCTESHDVTLFECNFSALRIMSRLPRWPLWKFQLFGLGRWSRLPKVNTMALIYYSPDSLKKIKFDLLNLTKNW